MFLTTLTPSLSLFASFLSRARGTVKYYMHAHTWVSIENQMCRFLCRGYTYSIR